LVAVIRTGDKPPAAGFRPEKILLGAGARELVAFWGTPPGSGVVG
jgi:hypothetical protein